MSSRVNGKVRNDLSPDAVIKSIHIGQGLGSTSAYTWMKLPVVDEMDRVMEATTLPTLLLGGDPPDPDEAFASWEKALGAAVGARTDRRPHPALPAPTTTSLRGRHRRVDGEVTCTASSTSPRAARRLPFTVDVTPESAGWTESSLQVLELDDTPARGAHTGDTEVMILPLAGGGTVECDGETFELSPRASVFDGPADMVYLGIEQTYAISGEGRFAICGARAKRSFPNRRVAAADVVRRTARRGQLQPPGAQLRHRRHVRGRLADRV